MCGIVGMISQKPVNQRLYDALLLLQHRGQDAAGIGTLDGLTFHVHKAMGLVRDVFRTRNMRDLTGNVGIGHVRYPTQGCASSNQESQPFYVNAPYGIMLAHNGNLTNALELRRQLENEGAIFHGSSDTEVICYLITRNRLRMGSIETAISKTMDVLEGAYSLVIMSATKLIAVRDPRGYRPLCIGTLPGGGYVFASESCALDATGASLLRDVEPGEIVVVDTKTGELRSIKDHCGRPDTQMCVFEFIYFARPDSVIEGSSVHEARKQAGRFLAQEHPVEADVVIGVPDSGLDAALGYSQESGIPYGIGFIKNKYIGRTFIQGSQKQRENSVRIKLNVVSSTVKGKRVVLVDDSIVRGTTSARIIKLLRDAGAAEVHFMVSAPPFKYPCYFGTDIPDQKLLVATGRTLEQINEVIGADTLGYLSNEHVVQLAKNAKCGFCTACFTGEYAVEPESVLSTDIHDRHLNDHPKDAKKLGE